MAKLLPFRQSDTTIEPRRPRLVELDDETADAVFAALSAETARDILGRLYDEPGTATDVAEAADTSLQNARYHLDKLQSAGLVEAVDTWYSSRGTEMTVYAPTNEPLVVAAGPDEQTSVLRSALGRLVGALGVLGIASLLVDRLARSGLAGVLPVAGAGGADGAPETELAAEEDTTFQAADVANATATPTEAPTPSPTPVATAEPTPTPETTPTPTPMAEATGTPMPTPEPTSVTTRVVERTVVQEATVTAPKASPTPIPTDTPVPAAMPDGGLLDLGAGLPPGALFFLGGLVVLAVVAAWWYWRAYRPLYG